MKIIETNFSGLMIIEPKIFEDQRGYFFESYNKKELLEKGINLNFVQDNQSSSNYGVIRGLHYQLPPYSQTKLVRVIKGKVLDVVVDLRMNSPTYGKVFKIKLSSKNKLQLLIPKGFAHGFTVLSKQAIFTYKCDNYYMPEYEGGINPLDKNLDIDWEVDEHHVSEKDLKLPGFIKL